MPIVLGLVLFLFLWMHFEGSKANRKNQKIKDSFWDKENQANVTRKVDIKGLDYIKIPIESLPFTNTTDEVLISLQHSIRSLSQTQILNLTGFTNTDLKLKYGVANITVLSQCDNNYTLLVNALYKWGFYLYEHGQIQDATTVLEFGIQCRTDVSKNYLLLAKIYKDLSSPKKIKDLILVAETLQSLTKDYVLSSLKEITLSSYLV